MMGGRVRNYFAVLIAILTGYYIDRQHLYTQKILYKNDFEHHILLCKLEASTSMKPLYINTPESQC